MAKAKKFALRPRILLLEPERQRVDEFRDVFEQNGFETEVALNREVALAVLSERRMDVLLLDAEAVKEICGELVREFHELDREMMICVINGVKEKPKQRIVKRFGAKSYLSAPTDGDKALRAIQNILGTK